MTTPARCSRRCSSLAALLALAACGPGEVAYVYRDGATVAQADRASFDCRIAAAREVPADTQVRSTPAWTTPVYTDCVTSDGQTSCVTSGGITFGGEVYPYDANVGLRDEYFRRCLAEAGFALTVLPACPAGAVTTGLRQRLSGRQRLPTPDACVVQVTAEGANLALPGELTESGG